MKFLARIFSDIADCLLACGVASAQPVSPLGYEASTITTGGTAQNLFSGNKPLNGWEVCNPDAANDLWVSEVGTAAANAAGSYRVASNGGCYSTPQISTPTSLGPVSIVGANTGQKYSARRW